MTTFEPGASDVFTHGLRESPFSTAFFASSAAPIITVGLDVLVHEVMAATTTAPWSTSTCWPSRLTVAGLLGRPPRSAAFGRRVRRAGRSVAVADRDRVAGRERLGAGLVDLGLRRLDVRGVVGQRGAERGLRVGRARPGPAGASGRRSTARSSRGRARWSRRRPARPSGRARGPAPSRTPRRARRATRRGRSSAGSGSSRRRWGTSPRWSRTPGSCCRWWPGWRAAPRCTPSP